MLRRTFFRAGGAAVLSPLLPETKADEVVPTPVVEVDGRRVPVIRYKGRFLDGETLYIWINGIRSFALEANARSLAPIIKELATRGRCVIIMDQDGHFMRTPTWVRYDDPDNWRIVPWHPSEQPEPRYLSDRMFARGITIKDMVRQVYASLGRI